MRIKGCLVVALWLLLAGLAVAQEQERFQPQLTRYNMLLTSQDVERVLGIVGGIREVPKDPAHGAGGDQNFAFRRGRVILEVEGEDVVPEEFAKTKKTALFRNMYAFQFNGLGDDAYQGPAHATFPNVLSFQKGSHWITLTSGYTRRGAKPILNMDQLIELANLVLQRL